MADKDFHKIHAPKISVSNLKQNIDRSILQIKNNIVDNRKRIVNVLPRTVETVPDLSGLHELKLSDKEIKNLKNVLYLIVLSFVLSLTNFDQVSEDARNWMAEIFKQKEQIGLNNGGEINNQKPNFESAGNGGNNTEAVFSSTDEDDLKKKSLELAPPDSITFNSVIQFLNTIPDVINVPHGDSVFISGIEVPPNVTISFAIAPQNEIVKVGDKIKFVANDLPDEYSYEISVRNLLDPTQNQDLTKIMRIHGGPIIDSISPKNNIPVIREISNQISTFAVDYKHNVQKTGVVFSSFKNKNLNFVYENTGNFSSSTSEHKFLNLGDYGTIKIRSSYDSRNVPPDTTTVEWKVLPPEDQPFNYALKDSVFWHPSLGWVRKMQDRGWVISTEPTIVNEGETGLLRGKFVVNRDTFNLNNLEHFQKFNMNYLFSNDSDILFYTENLNGTKKDSTLIKVFLADTNNVTGVKDVVNKPVFDNKNVKISPPFPNSTPDGKFKIELEVNTIHENIGEIRVKAEVFDLNGKFIKRNEQTILPNQTQNMDFDIADCASGIYLVKLLISNGKNEYNVMRKIMYVK